MRSTETTAEEKDEYACPRRNNGSGGVLLTVGSTQHRRSLFSASGTALVFDPRRASWQPLRPCAALPYSDVVTTSAAPKTTGSLATSEAKLAADSGETALSDSDTDRGPIRETVLPPGSVVPHASSGPRLSTNAPARIMTIDRWGPHTRNIAPKARIIKNVLVLGCSYMCSYGCFAPLRTYLSVTLDLKMLAPLALVIIELSSAVSCFYGSIVARKLTYKMTIALCQVPFALLLVALAYSHYYTIIPAALLLGLSRGPLWNATVAYLINMAAQFAYFSYETQDKMVKRFIGTFNTLTACGWTWGHLLTAGAFSALESARNDTKPWYECATGGSRYCDPPEILDFPVFRWTANTSASGGKYLSLPDSRVVPLYSTTVYAGNVICAVVLALFLLDKLKVQLCSQTNKPASARQLFSEMTQIFFHERIRLLLPMFVFIGLQEAFIICDVMKAYVACTAPRSTIGYVMFAYGLVNTFLCAFLCAAIRHIRRITVLMAGLACQLGALVVMWMWKPVADDQPILYVISAAWSMSDSIWRTLCQTMVYQSFPEQWEAPFAVFYMGKAVGLASGFLISPFGCLEYKIYFLASASTAALLPFAIQELQAHKSDWFSSSLSPSSSD